MRAVAIAVAGAVAAVLVALAVAALTGLGPFRPAPAGSANGSAAGSAAATSDQDDFVHLSRDVALVLDVSGSMEGDPLAQMQNAASSFVDTAIDGGARTGLISYSTSATVLHDLTTDADALKQGISALKAQGDTNIEAALTAAQQMLDAGGADRKIIVLMSDGKPTKGKTGTELIDYAQALKDAGYRIYTVGLNEGAEGHSLLTDIANEGCHYEVRAASDLEGFFNDIADEVSGSRYVYVHVTLPSAGADVSVSHSGETLSTRTGDGNGSESGGSADGGGDSASDAGSGKGTGTKGDSGSKGSGSGSDKDAGSTGGGSGSTGPNGSGATGGGASSGAAAGRTSFGTLTYEDEVAEDGSVTRAGAIVVLRLKEGPAYNIDISGNGAGGDAGASDTANEADVSVGYAGEAGDYRDFRTFKGVPIRKGGAAALSVTTRDEAADGTRIVLDENGDGLADTFWQAGEGETADPENEGDGRTIDPRAIVGVTVAVAVLLIARYALAFIQLLPVERAAIAIAVTVLAAGGLGAVTVWQTGALSDLLPQTGTDEDAQQEKTAHYGALNTIELAPGARVVPKGADGKALKRYTVHVWRAQDAQGRDLDLSGAKDLSVSDGTGFAISNLLAGIKGASLCRAYVVTGDGGAQMPLPPISISDKGTTGTVSVTPPADDSASASAPYASAYLSKIEEYQARFGDKSAVWGWNRSNDRTGYVIGGLSFAKLVDFGDGNPRLVLAYCEDGNIAKDLESDSGDESLGHKVEVWNYADGGIELEYQGFTSTGEQILFDPNPRNSSGVCMIPTFWQNGGDNETLATFPVIGLLDDGSVGKIPDMTPLDLRDSDPSDTECHAFCTIFPEERDDLVKTLQTVSDTTDQLRKLLPTEESESNERGTATYASAYLDKIEKYQKKYGEPGIDRKSNISWATGLYYAKLVDFGDGTTRLVVSYFSDPENPPAAHGNGDGYTSEVWAFDSASDSMKKEWSGGIFVGGDSMSMKYERVSTPSGETRLFLQQGRYQPQTDSNTKDSVGLRDDGTFGEVSESEIAAMGDPVSSDGTISEPDAPVCAVQGNYLEESGVLDIVPNTIDQLKQLLSDEDSKSGSKGDADFSEVTAKEVLSTVSVPTADPGDPGPYDYYFGYLQLSGGVPKVTKKLNEQFKADYDTALKVTRSITVNQDGSVSAADDGKIDSSYRSSMTYCKDGVMAMRVQHYVGTTHQMLECAGAVYDLKTGKKIEPWDLAGMNKSDLDAAAVDAVATFIRNNPDRVSNDVTEADASDIVGGGTYLVTQEGITIMTASYALGSYGDGWAEIVVKAFDDPSLVGTDVFDEYFLPVSPES